MFLCHENHNIISFSILASETIQIIILNNLVVFDEYLITYVQNKSITFAENWLVAYAHHEYVDLK